MINRLFNLEKKMIIVFLINILFDLNDGNFVNQLRIMFVQKYS